MAQITRHKPLGAGADRSAANESCGLRSADRRRARAPLRNNLASVVEGTAGASRLRHGTFASRRSGASKSQPSRCVLLRSGATRRAAHAWRPRCPAKLSARRTSLYRGARPGRERPTIDAAGKSWLLETILRDIFAECVLHLRVASAPAADSEGHALLTAILALPYVYADQ